MVALAQNDGGKSGFARLVDRSIPAPAPRPSPRPCPAEAVFVLAQRKTGGGVVTGPQRFCVAQVAFEIAGAGNCSTRGLAEAGFARTQTKGHERLCCPHRSLGLVQK